MPVPSSQPPVESESKGGCLPALFRLAWIFGGIVIIYCGLFVAQAKGGVIADLLLWVLTLGIILVRFIDIRYLKGETRDNKPATMKHWRRYALMMLVFAGILYALAKFVASKNLL
jgi:hypothetical protein